MISYEELVAALDAYVARNGGTPQSAHAPASHAPASHAPAFAPPPPVEHYDEQHDPDMGSIGGDGMDADSTHVGASPGGAPAQSHDDHSNEIDIGDVLADDEL